MLELFFDIPHMAPRYWWGLFALIGIICGFLPKEKLLYLRYIIFISCLLWTFVFLQIRMHRMAFMRVLIDYSIPQFLFFIIPYRLADFYNKSKSKELERKIVLKTEKNLRKRIMEEHQAKYPRIKSTNFDIVVGKGHITERNKAIKSAKESLIITSGWVSNYVIEDDFIENLKLAINRGVQIRFVYGYKDIKGNHNSSKEAIQILDDFAAKNSNQFKVLKKANHSKVLIVDKKYAICGSFNWLSNNIANNEEYSFKSEDPLLINELSNSIKLIANG